MSPMRLVRWRKEDVKGVSRSLVNNLRKQRFL